MRNKRAQSTVEYAALVAIIIGALITVGVYFKRGIQGRWKASVDQLGEQYDPRATNANITYRRQVDSQTSVTTVNATTGQGIWTMRQDQINSTESKTGFSRTAATP